MSLLLAASLLPRAVAAQPLGPADRLVDAARSCQLTEVKTLLDAAVSPSARSRYGETALFAAAPFERCRQVIDLLLERGADPDEFSLPLGIPPLEEARNHERAEVVERLLRAGATDYAKLMPDCGAAANAPGHRDVRMRLFATHVLRRCGGAAVGPLGRLVRDEDPSVDVLASQALVSLHNGGVSVAAAAGDLVAVLDKRRVGLFAAEALLRIQPASRPRLEAVLLRYLDDPDPYYQERALGSLGESAPPAKLVHFLSSRDEALRGTAIGILERSAAALDAARRSTPPLERCGVPGLVPNCYAKPCELPGDFDADGRIDLAQLVSRGPDRPKGIAFLLASGRCAVAGAGTELDGGGGDDFDWVDAWRLGQHPGGKGTAVEAGKENASGLIYWRRGRLRWRQQAD